MLVVFILDFVIIRVWHGYTVGRDFPHRTRICAVVWVVSHETHGIFIINIIIYETTAISLSEKLNNSINKKRGGGGTHCCCCSRRCTPALVCTRLLSFMFACHYSFVVACHYSCVFAWLHLHVLGM